MQSPVVTGSIWNVLESTTKSWRASLWSAVKQIRLYPRPRRNCPGRCARCSPRTLRKQLWGLLLRQERRTAPAFPASAGGPPGTRKRGACRPATTSEGNNATFSNHWSGLFRCQAEETDIGIQPVVFTRATLNREGDLLAVRRPRKVQQWPASEESCSGRPLSRSSRYSWDPWRRCPMSRTSTGLDSFSPFEGFCSGARKAMAEPSGDQAISDTPSGRSICRMEGLWWKHSTERAGFSSRSFERKRPLAVGRPTWQNGHRPWLIWWGGPPATSASHTVKW